MAEEKAVVRKGRNDLLEGSRPDARVYEVIVKFHKDGRAMIEAFLLTNMAGVTVAATQNPEVLLAYCHFEGDIRTLDGKLAALRQSAMVVLGDEEEKFLDFFVAMRQLSQPLPRLLTSGQSSILSMLAKPGWVGGFLAAAGLFALWQGYQFFSVRISDMLNPPRQLTISSSPVVSEWSPYVLPEYHQAWLEVRKKHGLSNEMMLRLFQVIKRIDQYGPGHPLRDLTIYPQAIDRALGLIILKDVDSVDELQALYKTLHGYSAQWKSFPDRPEQGRGLALSDSDAMFGDQVVLLFFEHLLERPRQEFTETLIKELNQAHFSG